MKLVLERVQCADTFTIGSLAINGVFECWTLEDAVRIGEKIPGSTAIPYGTYDIAITFSPHFQRPLPLLIDVPGYSGVRIHPGNTPHDTRGCILPGLDRYGDGRMGRSKTAFNSLFKRLLEADAVKDHITIEITKPQPGDVAA